MDEDLHVAKSLSVVERLAALMCHEPANLKMDVEIGATIISITFVAADTIDSRRLVGTGGGRLTDFNELAMMMLNHVGRRVMLGRVEKKKDIAVPLGNFKANPAWPRKEIELLFKDAVESCFPDSKTGVKFKDTSNEATFLKAVLPEVNGEAREFARLMNNLLEPISAQQGRRLIADVEAAT